GNESLHKIGFICDVADRFIPQMVEVCVLAEDKIAEEIMTIPGNDGEKMSKSRNNFINIFEDDQKLRKQIMAIVTDATPLEDPKNPDTCNVFSLYKLLGTTEQVDQMRANYEGGNYGYGHAKQA